MVIKRRLGSLAAVLALALAFPTLASAHTLAVSVSPSQCVSPLNGSYRATVTVTETYFSGSTEAIPVGQNVQELATSTDRGNRGLNQNYFTQGSVGTQTGPADLGQPTLFSSPASGQPAAQQFTVTTSLPETYVLQNSYMVLPATGAITAPAHGCQPVTPQVIGVSASATTQCSSPLNSTYEATIDVTATRAFSVPAGTSGGSGGVNFFTPTANGQPAAFQSGDTVFTVVGLTAPTLYAVGAPGGNLATVALAAPSGGCQPPTTVTPSCTTGQTMSGGQCVPVSQCECTPPPPTCPSGQTMSGGKCVTPCPCAPTFIPLQQAKKETASCLRLSGPRPLWVGQRATLTVSVRLCGASASKGKARVTLPGGRQVTKTVPSNGAVRFTITPTRGGTLYVQSTCSRGVATVLVAATRPRRRVPGFTG